MTEYAIELEEEPVQKLQERHDEDKKSFEAAANDVVKNNA